MKTEELIDTGLHHLARFAFFTRDNPFLSSRAAVRLPPPHRAILVALLDGQLDPQDWLSSTAASRLLREIQVGCVPRNVQLVTTDGQAKVGVADVHAFLRAPLFWWLVSILWCLTAGRTVDKYLAEAIKGYRLHSGFLSEPDQRGLMFRDHKVSYRAWKGFPTSVAGEFPGEVLATNTIDLRDFYYSSTAAPSEIVAKLMRSRGKRLRRGSRSHALTYLLDALHGKYATRCHEIKPRPHLTPESVPLPVGLPSSRILANVIVDRACEDLEAQPSVEGVAAYADDLLVMSLELPAMTETPAEYLMRLGLIVDAEDPRLNSPRSQQVASLVIGLEKSATSYSRSSTGEDETDEGQDGTAREDPTLDPYIEGHPDPDWGGRLRTVLRAPQRAERIPRELVRELEQMVDEIRIGLDPLEAEARLESFVEEIDGGLFLALRPHWVDLLVVGITAAGAEFIKTISSHYVRLVDELVSPPQSSHAMREALRVGLRASWVQALAQALAVARGRKELDTLAVELPIVFEQTTLGIIRTLDVVRYAKRLRQRRLVPATLVSAPLAEFTSWDGPLIGAEAFSSFSRWAATLSANQRRRELMEGIAESVRFVQLHEVCLALHLWAGEQSARTNWLEDAFALLRQQPLIQPDQVEDLAKRAAECSQLDDRDIADVADAPALRFALPSFPIDDKQLPALLAGETGPTNEIAARARRRIRSIVGISTRNKADVLVLPEWSLPPQQLPWLMSRAADADMLVVAGQSPSLRDGRYSNRLWTGIPVQDSEGHKECLVVPPREKRFLSPTELHLLSELEIEHADFDDSVPVYEWKVVRFASLVCFEFADIAARTSLRGTADLLTVSSLNKDWRYFDAIQEATTRDNYCLTVCVNSGAFPGTKIMRPTSSAMSVAASVHGSDDPAVVSRKIDMHPILIARTTELRPSEATEREPVDDTDLDDYRAFRPI